MTVMIIIASAVGSALFPRPRTTPSETPRVARDKHGTEPLGWLYTNPSPPEVN